MTPPTLAGPTGVSRRRGAWALLLLVGALLLRTAPVTAQPAAVEDLIRKAVELRREGKDHLALPLFQKAYDLEPSGRTSGQLGLSEASLGYWIAAERHLSESLSSNLNPWVARNESQLRKTLLNIQASIGEVEITGSPAGATITVNGQAVGKLPLPRPVRVPQGTVNVSMSAPRHQSAATSAAIQGGQRIKVTLALEPQAVASEPATPPPQARPQPEQGSEPAARVRRRSGGGWVRPASWVAAAAGVAALAVGGYGLSAQRSRVKEFDRYMPPNSGTQTCNLQAPQMGGPECKEILQRIDSAERLAAVGFVAGGVLVAGALAGLVYSALSDGDPNGEEDAPRDPELALSFTPLHLSSELQLGLRLRF